MTGLSQTEEDLNSTIANAVAAGFNETGLVAKIGPGLLAGLRGYVTLMMSGFTHRGAMYERYQLERARLAALTGNSYFNATLGLIQAGDLSLFHGGLFFSGLHLQEEAARAVSSYLNVALLLRGNREEQRFFGFLHLHVPVIMEGLAATAQHMNIPRQRNVRIYFPEVERQFKD